MTSIEKWEAAHLPRPKSSILHIPDLRKAPLSLRRWSACFPGPTRSYCARPIPDSWIKAGRFYSGDPDWIPQVNYLLWYLPAPTEEEKK